jgi:hypothetical protein
MPSSYKVGVFRQPGGATNPTGCRILRTHHFNWLNLWRGTQEGSSPR